MESFGDLVERVFEKIQTHTGWDDEKVNRWFLIENPFFGDLTPNNYLFKRPDKMERIVDSLIAEATPWELASPPVAETPEAVHVGGDVTTGDA